MTDTFRTILIAAVALGAGLTWLGTRAAWIPVESPDRLVAELRLALVAALLLASISGAYIGFAVAQEQQPGTSLDAALAIGFFLVAAATLVRDPRQALTILALAFAAHALVDVARGAGPLPGGVAPTWYAVGSAVFDLYVGVVTYLPVLRRGT